MSVPTSPPPPPPPPVPTTSAFVYDFNVRDNNRGDCASPAPSERVYQSVAGAYVSNTDPCMLLSDISLRNSNPLNDLVDLPNYFRTPFASDQGLLEFEFKQEFLGVTGPYNRAQSHGSLYFCNEQSKCFYYVLPSANLHFTESENNVTFDQTPTAEPIVRLSHVLSNSAAFGSVVGASSSNTPGGGFAQFKFSINFQQFQHALNHLPGDYTRNPASYRLMNYHINNEVKGNVGVFSIFTRTWDAVLKVRK